MSFYTIRTNGYIGSFFAMVWGFSNKMMAIGMGKCSEVVYEAYTWQHDNIPFKYSWEEVPRTIAFISGMKILLLSFLLVTRVKIFPFCFEVTTSQV